MSARNVVLVTIDSLRADHCGFMGYNRTTTPTLDAMATEGLVFENAIAPGPSTYESMPAILTERPMCEYPLGEGDALDRRVEQIGLNTRRRSIAEWFAGRGYETAAFTTNPYTGAHTNFARGFDRFEDFLEGGEGPVMRRAAHVPVLSELKHLVTLARGDRASKPWRSYYDEVLEWVHEASEPYFLWVFLLDAHTPYLVPKEYRNGSQWAMYYHNWRLWVANKWGIDLDLDSSALVEYYDGAIRSTDVFLARLRDDLDSPVIAVHADHGEAFGEHGIYGHESTLYEENIHVPLVLENTATTGTVRRPLSLAHLPRLLRGAATDAVSIPESAYAIARTSGPRRLAVRGTDWKYVATVAPDRRRIVAEECYDLAADPAERRNLAENRQKLVATCRERLSRRLGHEREARAVFRAASEVVA